MGRREGGREGREDLDLSKFMEGISKMTMALGIQALTNTSRKKTSPQGGSQITDLERLPPRPFALQSRG